MPQETGHPGKPLPRVPLGHLLPQHEFVWSLLFQFGLQGCNPCHELCLPSALCGDTGLSGCLGSSGSHLLMGQLQRPQEEDSLPMFLQKLQDAPQSRCFSKGSRGRVHGTSRAESTQNSPTARGKGRISGDKHSAFGVTMRSWHSSAPTPFPSPSSYTVLREGDRPGGEQWEARTPQHLAGKPRACTASPVSSGVTTAVSWAVSPAVARLVAPLAQLWHHVLVMVAAPESRSPLDMVRLARRSWGRASGLVALRSRDAVRPWAVAATPSPLLGTRGGHISCRWPWGWFKLCWDLGRAL